MSKASSPTTSSSSSSSSSTSTSVSPAPSSSSKLWAAGVAFLVGGAALAYTVYQWRKHTRQQNDVQHSCCSHSHSHPPSSALASSSSRVVRIGTRDSALALWQANFVRDSLSAAHPQLQFQVVGLKTLGDLDLSTPLSKFSNKGVFTKELDVALLNGQIDIAVHCTKDLPTVIPPGLKIIAAIERGNTQDALVVSTKHREAGIRSLAALPVGAIVGTSAVRRRAVLSKLYPHLIVKEVRGNVNTRLRKLDDGEYDAIILAEIGLKRLGFAERIADVLPLDSFGYAVGQGALAILGREHDSEHEEIARSIHHSLTAIACEAERSLLRTLQGGCKVPITVHSAFKLLPPADTTNDSKVDFAKLSPLQPHPALKSSRLELTVNGGVISEDGKREVRLTVRRQFQCLQDLSSWSASSSSSAADSISALTYASLPTHVEQHFLQLADDAGKELANGLLDGGARQILMEVLQHVDEKSGPQDKPTKQ